MTPSQPLLQGQTAIVTGASSGIGAAVARALAVQGAAVSVNYRNSLDQARTVVDAIRADGGHAQVVQADVSDESAVERLFASHGAAFGRLDILVANAGMQQDASITDMTLAQWQAVLDVNLTGQFLCVREAVRYFQRQKASPSSRARGKIVCMSSVHELIPWSGHVNYAASKGGAMQLMKTVAQEVAATGIRVNGIAPGAIQTEINEAVWSTPEGLKALLELIPYGRIGQPADVANAAVWLASDQSDYVTGSTLFVDGGMGLYPAFRDHG
jgi:glucose 1-dehydrogenase